jgi:excisionase family DNA binding protein
MGSAIKVQIELDEDQLGFIIDQLAERLLPEFRRRAAEQKLNRLLKPEDVCELLQVPKTTLMYWVSENGLPMRKLGSRSIRFDPDELAEWIEGRSVKGEETDEIVARILEREVKKR